MNEPAKKAPAKDTIYPAAFEMVNDFIERFSEEVSAQLPPLDDKGHTAVRHGDRIVGINVSPDHDVLLFLTEMTTDHEIEPGEFHRRALELNFLATGSSALAIDPESGTVYLRSLRNLAGLDYSGFRELLSSMVTVADELAAKLLPSP